MKNRNYNRQIKDSAKSMYLRGDSFRQIAKALGCTHMAVSKWCHDEKWSDCRNKIYAENSEIVAANAKDLLSNMQVQKQTAYQNIMQKGLEELPQAKVGSAREAVHLIEIGIKGLPSIGQAAIHRRFIAEVGEIIRSEVPDEETRRRIAQRLREHGERYSEDNSIKPI